VVSMVVVITDFQSTANLAQFVGRDIGGERLGPGSARESVAPIPHRLRKTGTLVD
jgi:hypothetical protein